MVTEKSYIREGNEEIGISFILLKKKMDTVKDLIEEWIKEEAKRHVLEILIFSPFIEILVLTSFLVLM